MAEYSGNDVYLRMNAVNIETYWREMTMDFESGEEDTSAGAGIDWSKSAAKLSKIKAKISIIHDDVVAATTLAALWEENMIVVVDYGPEGNAAGKPRHTQSFKINSISGPTTKHDKALVMYEFDMVSTGVPTANLYAGATF